MSLQYRFLFVALVLSISARIGFASSWEAVGPYGGHAQKIVMDPLDREHLYTTTKNGQIYQSMDAGRKWTRLPFTLTPASTLNAFVINPSNPKELYVGVARNFAQSGDAGIFRSQDGGLHWTQLKETEDSSVLSLAIHPTQTNIIVAGTEKGVLRSVDAGSTWKQISPENHAKLKAVVSVAINPENPNVLYAGTTHLPWKTSDGGTTWQSIHEGMKDDSDVFSIVVNPANTQQVLLGACGGIFRSTTGGARWVGVTGIPEASHRTYQIAQDPMNPQTFYAATAQGLWKSTDNGMTWKQPSRYPYIVNSLVIDPQDSKTLYIATDRSGLLKSVDGGATFAPANGGFVNRNIVRLIGEDALYVASAYDGDFGGVFTTTDQGGNWALNANQGALKGKNILSFAVSPHDAFRMLAGTYDGLLGSTDAGKTWLLVQTSSKTGGISGKVYDVAFSGVDAATVYAATDHGLFKSTNEGKTWTANPASALNTTVYKLALHPSDSKLMMARTDRGVWVSRNGGVLWNVLDLGTETRVFDLAFSFAGSTVFAATSDGLLYSSDDGQTWKRMENGLPGRRLDQVVLLKNKPQEIYVLRRDSHEMWMSSNTGTEWHRVDARGLEGTSLLSLSVVGGQPYMVTESDGIFRLVTQK